MSFAVLLYHNAKAYSPFQHALERCANRSAENWRDEFPSAHVVPTHRLPMRVGNAKDLRLALGGQF